MFTNFKSQWVASIRTSQCNSYSNTDDIAERTPTCLQQHSLVGTFHVADACSILPLVSNLFLLLDPELASKAARGDVRSEGRHFVQPLRSCSFVSIVAPLSLHIFSSRSSFILPQTNRFAPANNSVRPTQVNIAVEREIQMETYIESERPDDDKFGGRPHSATEPDPYGIRPVDSEAVKANGF